MRCYNHRSQIALLIALLMGPISTTQAEPASDRQPHTFKPLVAALHVHSTFSTGSLTLDQLASRAEQLGIDAIILSENFALRYEYGIPPLRGVLRRAVTVPSLSAQRIAQFLAQLADVQTRHPRVLLIPGVEVAPHYYWTGSLWERNLTMHNSQRNLLVLGLPKAEDYAALPLSGNQDSYRYGWTSVSNLTPILLCIPAGWLWRRSKAPVWGGRLCKTAGLMLATLACLLLFNAWPFGQPVFSSYDDQLEYRPYQTLIDAATSRGGLVIWSLPEARDQRVYSFGPLGTVAVETAPYPEALLKTSGFTGFGGLYQDTRHIQDPGGIWDQGISRFLKHQRQLPPYLFGEIAFHTPGEAGIALDQVLNVLWVNTWSVPGILEAMRQGRLYAVGQYQPGHGLRLDEFRLDCTDGSCTAASGDRLELHHAKDLVIRVSVSATNHAAHPISVTLVRSGQVRARIEGVTPLKHSFFESASNLEFPGSYRIEVQGKGEILSNPIFLGQPLADMTSQANG